MIEKKLRLIDLFDFYGKVLTEKQIEIMALYCNLDLSLGEIAENLDISRQAVYDTIKRSEKILEKHENKLGLYARFNKRQRDFETIVNLLETYKKSKDESVLDQVIKISQKYLD